MLWIPILLVAGTVIGCTSEDEPEETPPVPGTDGADFIDRIADAANQASEPDSSAMDAEPAPAPARLPPPERTGSVEVDGNIDTLFADQDHCFVITADLDGYKLIQADPSGISVLNAALPGYGQRSYGTSLRLSNGWFASVYQSTKNYGQQKGDQHGLILLDESGNLIGDYNLYPMHGVTRPTALLEHGGKLLALFNNCENTGSKQNPVKCLKPASLFALAVDQALTPLADETRIAGLMNAGAMGINGSGEIAVMAAGDYLQNAQGDSPVAMIDPATLHIKRLIPGLKGLGLNGNAPINAQGELLFTGKVDTGESLAILDATGLRTLPLPGDIAPVQAAAAQDTNNAFYVSGAVFRGGDILFGVSRYVQEAGQSFNRGLYYRMDPKTGESSQLGEEVTANFLLPFVGQGGVYCTGANQSGIDNQGNVKSTVHFWE